MVTKIHKDPIDTNAQKAVEGAVARGAIKDGLGRVTIRSIVNKIGLQDRRQASAK